MRLYSRIVAVIIRRYIERPMTALGTWTNFPFVSFLFDHRGPRRVDRFVRLVQTFLHSPYKFPVQMNSLPPVASGIYEIRYSLIGREKAMLRSRPVN